jgi:hypothetical protein
VETIRDAKAATAAIVNYADDLVICCRGTADLAMQTMREVTKKLQLEVNEDKSRICRVLEESFDFLGYTFGRCYSRKTGKVWARRHRRRASSESAMRSTPKLADTR